ncbi:hypothetical protein Nizo1840_2901 [Lactiplantibacillus plantarum]|nr:hypothetical protein FD10_GL000125 [Lactiplantibacillus argentoratensis DSM 16365]KTF01309.1 hypothetical protein SF2A35B_2070 [Lactiplantibacillus plantarum]KZT78199.1 hypothetical protein Nizo1840_2901 [Lactiplantibacillus plantarum]KZT79958.1 hypothetical protein Nizo1839_1709 [Lactiplantibacillus plantarum]KZU13477.1 hypothetical protein Nizo2264_1421 [Lactiplantibacillus plantarum]
MVVDWVGLTSILEVVGEIVSFMMKLVIGTDELIDEDRVAPFSSFQTWSGIIKPKW